MSAERRAGRASLAPVEREDWWDSASPEDLAVTWETARSWQDVDYISARMRAELRSRYDIDVDNLAADPAAVNAALGRRDDDLRRDADQRTRAVPRTRRPRCWSSVPNAQMPIASTELADAHAGGAAVAYDSAERRRDLACALLVEVLDDAAQPDRAGAQRGRDVGELRKASVWRRGSASTRPSSASPQTCSSVARARSSPSS